MARPTPPLAPIPPNAPEPGASATVIAHYRAACTAYEARRRVYDVAKIAFDRDMAAWEMAQQDAAAVQAAAVPAPVQPLVEAVATPLQAAPAPADPAPAVQQPQPVIPKELLDHISALTEQVAAQQQTIAALQLQQSAAAASQEEFPRFLRGADQPAPQTQNATDAGAEQIRYELAVQARNGSSYAIALLAREAETLGVPVDTLADDIIAQRQSREADVAAAYAQKAAEG